MVFAGLTLSSRGEAWQLYLGHGLLMGLIGNSAINAPLYIYVTKWFEARRGTAVALIASGPNVAGACWPPLFERAIAAYGWRQTMVAFRPHGGWHRRSAGCTVPAATSGHAQVRGHSRRWK
jgi:MFS family permease